MRRRSPKQKDVTEDSVIVLGRHPSFELGCCFRIVQTIKRGCWNLLKRRNRGFTYDGVAIIQREQKQCYVWLRFICDLFDAKSSFLKRVTSKELVGVH